MTFTQKAKDKNRGEEHLKQKTACPKAQKHERTLQ